MILTSTDPATGEVVWEGEAATGQDVSAALERARAAFPGWAGLPLDARIAQVHAFRDELERSRDSLAATISRETGKPRWETLSEVGSMIAKVAASIAAQAERAGERRSETAFGEAVLRHRPHGVMGVLGPFNFPCHLPNGHIVPALLAGDTLVFKPSELTPASGAAMVECWRRAGLPEGVLNIVQGARETGAALVEGNIDGLLFTGSAGAGAHFRRAFADRPNVILALELGGNNPLVAWDGDIGEAASIVVQSAFVTTGQRCSCARRLIVPDSPWGSELVEAVDALSRRIIIGKWDEEPQPYIGPLISEGAASSAKARVDDLIAHGARAIRDFKVLDCMSPAFVRPGIVDVTGVSVPDEEIFAPVLQVKRVPDFGAAIAAANDTRFGLAAGLVSEDDAAWATFIAQVRAGVVNRNRPTTGAAGKMPFGGLGESGNHRPSAFYAADYCAYPVASFEAKGPVGNVQAIAAMLKP